MTVVLDKFKESVDQVARHLNLRREPALEVESDDGLTEHERLELLVRYRSTVGAKPAATEAHRLRSEAIREKLQPRPRPRPRHGV